MKKQERIRPLDVDDLTHEGKSKTSINKKVTEERPKNMTEEEQTEYYVRISQTSKRSLSLSFTSVENIHREAQDEREEVRHVPQLR